MNPLDPADLARTAARLAAARRVLVTGLVGASVEAAAAACDIAEAVGAAVDFGQADVDRPSGPTIARAGAVTAAPEEMRDRADLVILWNCDPARSHHGIAALVSPRATIIRMPPAGADALTAARMLHHMVRSGTPPDLDAPWTADCAATRDAIVRAACVAVVTDDSADPLGIEPWAITHLVREIAHHKPAFEIPLRAADHSAAAAVCTWRYGAAGAIARADRDGGRFLPAEASARRIIGRGEVDCVLAVGRVVDEVEEAIARRCDGLEVFRVPADPEPLGVLLAAVESRPTGGLR
ncbi:MAG: hypothetical protein EBR28_00555 [Planctomycetia bacterium]|nr:hypothetical protein [Planctomycetia bacterium]